jgi:hypothetical protein
MFGKLAQLLGKVSRNAVRPVTNKVERNNVARVVAGEEPYAMVSLRYLDDYPTRYTQEKHGELLGKHGDEATTQYVDDLGHIKTVQQPGLAYQDFTNDVVYLRGLDGNSVGKSVIKPVARDKESYFRTGFISDRAKELNRAEKNAQTMLGGDYLGLLGPSERLASIKYEPYDRLSGPTGNFSQIANPQRPSTSSTRTLLRQSEPTNSISNYADYVKSLENAPWPRYDAAELAEIEALERAIGRSLR